MPANSLAFFGRNAIDISLGYQKHIGENELQCQQPTLIGPVTSFADRSIYAYPVDSAEVKADRAKDAGSMTYVKRIVCLANSFKIGGSCIAGREVLGKGKYGGWLRPVSSRPTAEVRVSECRYQNSAIPKLLDIIDVPLLKAVPHNHQTENHEIDAKSRWVKVGELPWDELEQLRERPASLWINSDSTSTGAFNCLSQAEAATLHDSLVLIKKKDFTVEVASNPWDGRRTYRGNFKYDGFYYSLSMTDPVATKAFAAKDEGEYELNDVYLCISLTEPYEKDGRCHKLVAAIISDPPL